MIGNKAFKYIQKWFLYVLALVGICIISVPCNALEPHEILVIANKKAADSVRLAKYYMKKRNIPKTNLVELWITDKEWCSRKEYEKRAIYKVRKHIKEKDPSNQIRCLVTMYGVPLKVQPPEMTDEQKRQAKDLRKRRNILNNRMKALDGSQKEQVQKLKKELKTLDKRITVLTRRDQRASFDSELALVLRDGYLLSGWIPNPYFVGFKNKKLSREGILLVSRLDGPSDKIVKRIIDDSIDTEKTGLAGSAYFDARWKRPTKIQNPKPKFDYAYYDRSIYLAAELVARNKLMSVVVNDKSELFKPGECPNAALYCGWYSLAKYVPAFSWQKGAVGYHIASSECRTLRSKNSQVWCKRMLEEGVAATIGPTSEPYVQAFPIPEIFFGLLADGRLSLAECYALAKPFWSWQMVLIGDPLYRPFGSVN